jgi:hypothetical protein
VFNIDPSLTHLGARREQVLRLIVSINAVAVKVPGIPTSPAMAYIAAWDAGAGLASVVIYLYYSAANRAVGYTFDPTRFPMADLSRVIDEAHEFLESMGFMLDDSGFGTLKPDDQRAIIERTPLFHKDLSGFAAARDAQELPEADFVEDAAAAAPAPAAEKAPPSTGVAASTSTERAQKIGRLLASF